MVRVSIRSVLELFRGWECQWECKCVCRSLRQWSEYLLESVGVDRISVGLSRNDQSS